MAAATATKSSDLWGLVAEAPGAATVTPAAARPSGLTTAFLTLLVALVIVVLVVGFLVMFTNLL